jgi:hypothetical protein
MMQPTLQLAFSVQGRQTAIGKKTAKKPVYFRTPCIKCGCTEASVSRNQDFVLWFSCPACGYENFWKTVSAKIREAKQVTSKYCPLDHCYIDDCGECEMCPE